MQVPVRLTALVRPSVPVGVLLASGFSAVVLSATPFLLDLVSDHYRLGRSTAALIGASQLSGFMVGSWGAGRWLRPRRRFFVAALVAAMVANLGSALLPPFAALVALRLVSGVALGVLTWLAWVRVFGEKRGMADIAVMGPLTGVFAGPLIAVVGGSSGAAGLFGLLGVCAVIPLLRNRDATINGTDAMPTDRRRTRPVPAAAVILIALGLFTLGGSAVFSHAVVLGTERTGLSIGVIGMLFSGNAIASIPATRWPWSRGWPGPWIAATGICAVVLATATSPMVFGAAVVLWGFFFWMATPAAFTVLAERSAHPGDRAGDAQAVMAGGRVVGPLLGGLVLDRLGTTELGLVGGSIMVAAASVVFVVRAVAEPRPPKANRMGSP